MLDIQSPNLKPGCIERYDQHIRGLAPFFKDVPLKKISALHCEDWLTNRASKLAKLTFKHELALLRTLFKYAIERGAIEKDPSRGIKAPRGHIRKDHSLKMAALVDFGSTLQVLPVAA